MAAHQRFHPANTGVGNTSRVRAKLAHRAWFAGYPHGVRAAEEEGAANWHQLQMSAGMQSQFQNTGVLNSSRGCLSNSGYDWSCKRLADTEHERGTNPGTCRRGL